MLKVGDVLREGLHSRAAVVQRRIAKLAHHVRRCQRCAIFDRAGCHTVQLVRMMLRPDNFLFRGDELIEARSEQLGRTVTLAGPRLETALVLWPGVGRRHWRHDLEAGAVPERGAGEHGLNHSMVSSGELLQRNFLEQIVHVTREVATLVHR